MPKHMYDPAKVEIVGIGFNQVPEQLHQFIAGLKANRIELFGIPQVTGDDGEYQIAKAKRDLLTSIINDLERIIDGE